VVLIPPLVGAAVGGTALVAGLHLIGQDRPLAVSLVLVGLALVPSPFVSPDTTVLGVLQVLVVLGWLVWFARTRAAAGPVGQSSSRSAEMNAS
jgi:hypothetical protein